MRLDRGASAYGQEERDDRCHGGADWWAGHAAQRSKVDATRPTRRIQATPLATRCLQGWRTDHVPTW